MAEISERYKHVKKCHTWYFILHLACILGPVLGFAIYGLANSPTDEKVIFSLTTTVAIIMALITLVFQDVGAKARMQKTITWILVIGIIYMLNDLKPFIWIMAITSVLDEIIFAPSYVRYGELVRTNKEIYLNANN